MRRTCSSSSLVAAVLNTALSETSFLAASLRGSAGPSIALSMASRSALNFTFRSSMPVPIAVASSRRARQVLAHRVHLVACAISIFAHLLVELLADRGVDRRRSIEDVGGKAALGIHVARDVADRAHHFQPALRHRDLVHGLIFGSRHVDGEAAADGGKRDDGGGEEGADFHGILAICAGAGMRTTSISGAN